MGKKIKVNSLLASIILICLSVISRAQNDTLSVNDTLSDSGDDILILSKTVKLTKDNVSVSGGFGGMGTSYTSIGVPAQRDPYFWQFNANINLQIGGVSFPFSAVLNQQERSFTQPFNQYGLSPRYKGITAHVGYRSLKFSDFSLAGNQFLGVGLEISPEKGIVRGKAIYGRFARAVDGYFTDGRVFGEPSFERWGMGGMLEIGTMKNNVGVVVFRAKDDQASITNFANDATIRPGENMVFGFTTNQKISKKVTFRGEIDWSAYTKDTRIDPSVLEGYTYLNNIPFFFANQTSSFSKAINADLSYNEKNYRLGINYRRIDPEYLTMGSVYLNNDFEDIQAKAMFKLFKNKLNFGGSGGVQRNNLNNDKASEMLRLISSVNANYTINKHWMLNGSFSNFNSQSQMALVNTLDTMRYAQVTQNANFQVIYGKSNDKVRNGVSIGANHQNAKINGMNNSVLYNANVAYQLGLLKSGLNINLGLNAATNESEQYVVGTLGPVFSMNKRFLNGKLNTAIASSALKTFISGVDSGMIMNAKGSCSYRVNRHHNISFNGSLISRTINTMSTQEILLSLGYNYSF
jgi:hypothetical protein